MAPQTQLFGTPTIPGNGMENYYQPPAQQQYGAGLPGDYSDPYNLYQAAVPIMQMNTDRSVGSAVSSLAPGNRYSSAAYNAAGKAGMEGGLNMNSMLTNLMYNQYNQDADRALQANGMLLSASPQVESAMSSRYGNMQDALAQRMKAWEQSRAAAMSSARMRYADFEKNKYGTLPMLMGALSNSIGQGPEPILSTKPGSSGYGSDIMTLLASYFMGKG